MSHAPDIDRFDFADLPIDTRVEVVVRGEIVDTLTVERGSTYTFFRDSEGGWLRMNNVVPFYGLQATYRLAELDDQIGVEYGPDDVADGRPF